MNAPATPIKAIKGTNLDMTCRGHQFEIGKQYTVDGKITACENGLHACPLDGETSPLAVFEYYAPGQSRYFEVEASGNTDREGNKIASASITLGVELSLGDLTQRCVDWVFVSTSKAKKKSNSGNHGAASNSGDYGVASNSGYRGVASNSGRYGAASNSGDYGAASNSGYYGAASNSGTRGAASNSGDYGVASNSGYRGVASNSGYRGVASNRGYYGAASNSGYYGAASNRGYYGVASNSGDYGVASNSGDYGVAFSHAPYGKVMCEGEGQVLACTEFADDGSVKSAAIGITGKKGIKAGVWYHCENGKLVKWVQS
jgi:hypothetical protein